MKLGGVNVVPAANQQGTQAITDVKNPTLVLGADVAHPAPGSTGRPSFTALVGSLDSNASKYVATSRAQTSRQEMIDDLQSMTEVRYSLVFGCTQSLTSIHRQHVLKMYYQYRKDEEKKKENIWPTRILYFRDGVSEGNVVFDRFVLMS